MKQKVDSYKQTAMRGSGTLNPRPEEVRAMVFQMGDFFDANDLAQVKYEMLRSVEIDGVSVSKSARMFGFSRVGWYRVKTNYDRHGLAGLLPQPRGPKKQTKGITQSS